MNITLATNPTAPVLVFGGPYSNARATRALIAEAACLGVSPARAICTGDVVAYCAEPEETAVLVRRWGCHVIAGNCEEQLAASAGDCGCGFEEGSACDRLAKGWYPYAAARVSAETRAWMAGLPRHLTFELAGVRCRVVHGGVRQTNRFVFASERDTLAGELASSGADLVIGGHAGVPFLADLGSGTWFNPGVIGMPANDGTTDVWYGLLRPARAGLTLSIHRLAYDHAGAAAAMRRQGYANEYARSLVTGIWPSFDVFPPAEKAATGRPIAPQEWTIAPAGRRRRPRRI